MITFITTIQKFEKQGEKTGWTYIEIPEAIATQLLPDNKKSFRVKGKLDNFEINGVALLPMGLGNFILAKFSAIFLFRSASSAICFSNSVFKEVKRSTKSKSSSSSAKPTYLPGVNT